MENKNELTSDPQMVKQLKDWVDYFENLARMDFYCLWKDPSVSVDYVKESLKNYLCQEDESHRDHIYRLKEIILARHLIRYIEKGCITVDTSAMKCIGYVIMKDPVQLVLPLIDSITGIDFERIARDPNRGTLGIYRDPNEDSTF